MASPGSRWQLLLMADDGHIIPFRRIKGLVIAFVVLFILLGLVCAGLGWWLVSETVRLEEAKKNLLETENQLAQCLVDLESRKLPPVEPEVELKNEAEAIEQLIEPVSSEPPETADSARTVSLPTVEGENRSQLAGDEDKSQPVGDDEKNQPVKESEKITPMEEGTVPSAETIAVAPQEVPEDTEPADLLSPEIPAVALGDALKVSFSEKDKILSARFRIKNTGPRSTPVRGRCVVVFKPDESGPDQWVALPSMALVNGEPTGTQGNRFKISKYLDMTINSVVAGSPSDFSTATVYVYDHSGGKITQKVYPVNLLLSD